MKLQFYFNLFCFYAEGAQERFPAWFVVMRFCFRCGCGYRRLRHDQAAAAQRVPDGAADGRGEGDPGRGEGHGDGVPGGDGQDQAGEREPAGAAAGHPAAGGRDGVAEYGGREPV